MLAISRIGSYEPLLELASGGMGVVYVARKLGDAGFERLVVLKRVHRHLLEDPECHAMLRDEARVASLLRHPHVVPVTDVVESHGELSLVLDYVESFSLAALLAGAKTRGERIPLPIVGRIMLDALAGLHAAHEAVDLEGRALDLIHRDVSPQNVIVGIDGTSRLIDFGIAKATARLSETGSGVLKGKLRYMSPEQARQGRLDRRSDIFSAGVVLYEAVTGQRLFPAEDPADLFLSILIAEIRPPSELVAELPAALDAVVLRALAMDKEDRFATAAEFEEALEQAIPVATAREVARYVEAFGGEVLEARRAKLRDLSRPLSTPPPSTAPVQTEITTIAAPEPRASATKKWRWKRAMPFALLGVIAGAGVLGGRSYWTKAPALQTQALAVATEPPSPPSVSVEPSASTPVFLPRASAAPRSHRPPSVPQPPPMLHRTPYRPSDLHRNPYAH